MKIISRFVTIAGYNYTIFFRVLSLTHGLIFTGSVEIQRTAESRQIQLSHTFMFGFVLGRQREIPHQSKKTIQV